MHSVFSNLTAALLALHTVLGCCWHHAHRCAEACAATGSAASSDSCDHARRASTAPDSDGQGHHGRHDCQGNTCVFVSFSKAAPHKPVFQFDASPAAAVRGDSVSVCHVVGQRPFYPPDALLPPLRLHLVYGMLLI